MTGHINTFILKKYHRRQWTSLSLVLLLDFWQNGIFRYAFVLYYSDYFCNDLQIMVRGRKLKITQKKH